MWLQLPIHLKSEVKHEIWKYSCSRTDVLIQQILKNESFSMVYTNMSDIVNQDIYFIFYHWHQINFRSAEAKNCVCGSRLDTLTTRLAE